MMKSFVELPSTTVIAIIETKVAWIEKDRELRKRDFIAEKRKLYRFFKRHLFEQWGWLKPLSDADIVLREELRCAKSWHSAPWWAYSYTVSVCTKLLRAAREGDTVFVNVDELDDIR